MVKFFENRKIQERSVTKILVCLKTANMWVSIDYISKNAGVFKGTIKTILEHLLEEGSINKISSTSGNLYAYKTVDQ